MIKELGLADIWREDNLECKHYTWRKPNPSKQSSLNFFLLSDYLVWHYNKADIDHFKTRIPSQMYKNEPGPITVNHTIISLR